MARPAPNIVTADREARLAAAMGAEERAGARLAAWGRAVAALAVSAYVLADAPDWASLYHVAFLAAFAALGGVYYQAHRRSWFRPWLRYLFLALDLSLLTYQLLVPNPLGENPLPAAIQLRLTPFDYFYLILAFTTFSFTPALVVACGLMTVAIWGLATLWVTMQPGSFTWLDFPVSTGTDWLARHANPYFADIARVVQQSFAFTLTAGIVTLGVWRSRRLLRSQLELERERANLSRYFSPNMVEELARMDDPLFDVRAHECAVMFVDIVGFTRMCEDMPPAEVIALLRDFHARVERAIFAHGGTLDKYIGDGVMATFGTLRPGLQDATNALLCACAIVEDIAAWSERRQTVGRAAVHVGIGVHYGPVVAGDVGGGRIYEFTVVGDTVNVASRLEQITRELASPVAVSAETVEAVVREQGRMPPRFEPGPARVLRGREEATALWIYRRPDGQATATG